MFGKSFRYATAFSVDQPSILPVPRVAVQKQCPRRCKARMTRHARRAPWHVFPAREFARESCYRDTGRDVSARFRTSVSATRPAFVSRPPKSNPHLI